MNGRDAIRKAAAKRGWTVVDIDYEPIRHYSGAAHGGGGFDMDEGGWTATLNDGTENIYFDEPFLTYRELVEEIMAEPDAAATQENRHEP